MEDTTEIDWNTAEQHSGLYQGGLSDEGEEMTYYNGYNPDTVATTEEPSFLQTVSSGIRQNSSIIIIVLLVIIIVLLLVRRKDS